MGENLDINELAKLAAKMTPEDALAVRRERLERNLYDFMRVGWEHADTAKFMRSEFVLQAICAHLEACAKGEIRNLIINIPPRCGKSIVVGSILPSWVFCQGIRGPLTGNGTQFLCASHSMILSTQDSIRCRRLIESGWYQSLWGDRVRLSEDQNVKTRFQLDSGGARIATSIGATTTGLGGDWLILDDPNPAGTEANSDAIIESTLEWFDSAWSTRANNPRTACNVIIQQRVSTRDITNHVLEQSIGEWEHLYLPMRFEAERKCHTSIWIDPREEEGELLWPERFGDDEVTILEKKLGAFTAAGQLQQRPEVKGGGIIKRLYWQPWQEEVFTQNFEYIVASVDTAYTTKEENDYSAMTVWGIWHDTGSESTSQTGPVGGRIEGQMRIDKADAPRIMLMNAWQGRMELHELIHKIHDTCRRLKVDTLLIENKASGISVSQEMRRVFGIEDYGLRLIDPKGGDKVARAYAVQHLFEEGLIWAPVDRVWCDMVITQCAQFPKGQHDDLVDTVTQALRFLRATGMIQRGVERTHELTENSRGWNSSSSQPLYPV